MSGGFFKQPYEFRVVHPCRRGNQLIPLLTYLVLPSSTVSWSMSAESISLHYLLTSSSLVPILGSFLLKVLSFLYLQIHQRHIANWSFQAPWDPMIDHPRLQVLSQPVCEGESAGLSIILLSISFCHRRRALPHNLKTWSRSSMVSDRASFTIGERGETSAGSLRIGHNPSM